MQYSVGEWIQLILRIAKLHHKSSSRSVWLHTDGIEFGTGLTPIDGEFHCSGAAESI